MDASDITLGIAIGAAGAAANLALLSVRARLVTGGAPRLAWGLMPASLATVGLSIYAATRISELAVWSAALGLLSLRGLVVARLRRHA